MRIAVTGASGVLGRGLAARLLSQGHDVVGIARHRPESWPSAADFVAADIRDTAAVNRAVAGADVVAHCAWAKTGPDDRISHQVNIGGTLNVLEAMAETGTRRIVFASSAHVYGWGDAPKAEHDAITPASPTAMYKARVERCWRTPTSNGSRSAPRSSSAEASTTGCAGCWRCRPFPTSTGLPIDIVQVVHIDDALRVFSARDPGHRNRQRPGQSRRPGRADLP